MAYNAGMTITAIRNNPYDLVPNIAGGNDISGSSLARSVKFRGLVFGDEVGASPHTLPFLGLETYADQLQLLGDREKSATVRKFIKTLPQGDSRI